MTNADLDMYPRTLCTGYQRPRRNERYAVRVANTLRAAVEFEIEITRVLEWLQDELRATRWPVRIWVRHEWLRANMSWLTWFPSVCWYRRLQNVIGYVREGVPLGNAMDREMGQFFPRYYVAAIRKAESDRKLDTVLPMMAKRLQYQQALVDDRMPYIPWFTFVCIVFTFVFLSHRVFILPVFRSMFADFGTSFPRSSAMILDGIYYAVLWGAAVGFLLYLVFENRGFREAVLPWIPIVAKEKRRLLVRDLAQSMSAFLAAGEDVAGAAAWSLETTDSPWLRKRLQRFVDDVRNGVSWSVAWTRMDLGAFAYPWLIANAAAREDPVGGFDTLAEWLHQDLIVSTGVIRRWTLPFLLLVLALFVGAVAYAVYRIIFQLGSVVTG